MVGRASILSPFPSLSCYCFPFLYIFRLFTDSIVNISFLPPPTYLFSSFSSLSFPSPHHHHFNLSRPLPWTSKSQPLILHLPFALPPQPALLPLPVSLALLATTTCLTNTATSNYSDITTWHVFFPCYFTSLFLSPKRTPPYLRHSLVTNFICHRWSHFTN